MDNNQEKFLPIGSVVMLKGGTKKAMITGFCSVTEDDKDKVYDYTGCVYPEGYLSFDEICLFNHDQIEKVYHLGFVDDEEKEFKSELINLCKRIESGEESINDYMVIDDEDVNTIIPDLDIESNKIDTQNDLEYL